MNWLKILQKRVWSVVAAMQNMEKQAPPRNKNNNLILKLLPKAASVVNFQGKPYSPRSDHHYHHRHKGFSGSIIPQEVRRKPKDESFEEQEEPTSPKVSCMGQIKHRKRIKKAAVAAAVVVNYNRVVSQKKTTATKIKKFFHLSAIKSKPRLGRRKSNASSNDDDDDWRAPRLSQINRFASGRDHALANFDWTAHQIAPVESESELREFNYYSDEERGDEWDDFAAAEEFRVPFSAPMVMGGGDEIQPKKEINLWKRRTMNAPRPLKLN